MVQHKTGLGRVEQAEDDEEVPFGGLVRYERHMPIHQVSYYLCGEIQAPQFYTELFYTLRTAAETDLIYLHINSPGGDFNTSAGRRGIIGLTFDPDHPNTLWISEDQSSCFQAETVIFDVEFVLFVVPFYATPLKYRFHISNIRPLG